MGEWAEVTKQLSLASDLSPNDLVILRQLGRAQLEQKDAKAAVETMQKMEELDAQVFQKDREAVALRCRSLADEGDWIAVDEHLANATPGLVSGDTYLANWRALASMKAKGAQPSLQHFEQLCVHLLKAGRGFWDGATLVNALLATGRFEEAGVRLEKLDLPHRPRDEMDSATRYFDEILTTFGHDFDWKAAARLQPTQ